MIKSFEILRIFTAVVVVIGHYRSILLPPLALVKDPSLPLKVFYLLSGYGHQAVLLFFLISGYLIGGRYLKNDYKIASEIKKRVVRIYPVFILSIMLSILLENTGMSLKDLVILFSGFGEIFGIRLENNLPLWSLSYEIIYYILFAYLFHSKNSSRLLGLLLVFILVIFAPKIILYSVFWLLGAFLSFERVKLYLSTNKRIIIALGIVAFVLVRFYRGDVGYINYSLNVLIVIMFAAILSEKLVKSDIGLPLAYLGRFSYPLYALHFPLILWSQGRFPYYYGIIVTVVLVICLMYLEKKILDWKRT